MRSFFFFILAICKCLLDQFFVLAVCKGLLESICIMILNLDVNIVFSVERRLFFLIDYQDSIEK